jgi:lysozyme family protein
MARELAFVDEIIHIEGGYVNDPDDNGRETKWGITIGTARKHGYTGAMKDLTKEQAKQIYVKEYYFGYGVDKITNDHIAFELFDTAVNMGPQTSILFLQQAWNMLNFEQNLGADLKEDGVLGPMTIQFVNKYPYPQRLHMAQNAIQMHAYVEIVRKKRSQRKFFFGWIHHRVVSQFFKVA